ncbi:hypothetical protein RRG08_001864 [Elysia crispata]|uniref:JmjC domain-containing protein n=1 Tax=Elysia crispata TaxID=231223 RepID=A0AAE1A3R6_9GAST|nr:hypothetical protein RRG08_001864 [Elysia crispata]
MSRTRAAKGQSTLHQDDSPAKKPPKSSSETPCTSRLSAVTARAAGIYASLPWIQLHPLNHLPRLVKVVIVLSTLVVILSVLINPGQGGSSFGYHSARICRAAGGVSAYMPFCMPDQTGGDWRPPSRLVWDQFGTDRCNIERVSILDLSPERFQAEYRFKKSVLVTFPHGAADWTTPANWSRRGLSEGYSKCDIHSGESLEIVRKGGNGNHVSSFKDYVDNFLMEDRAENDTSEPKHYACDRQFFWSSRLRADLRLPPYFQVNMTSDDSIFFLGPSLSGVVFHKHSDTWNGVVHGYKRWFLYPNTDSPPGGVYHGYTIVNWVKHVYPNLTDDEKPLECVQYPGEILYLAEGTYHATLNLGDTVAVAIQKKEATIKTERLAYEATPLMNFLQNQENPDPQNSFNQRLLEIYTEWHRLLPGNSEAVFKLASILSDMGNHSAAVPWYRKAIEMDRFFILAYLNLGSALTELRQYGEAETSLLTAIRLSPDLWDNYKEYGQFLLKRGRHQDALPIFKKGTELMPDLIPFWFYYKLCQVQVGDLTGAEATEEIIQEIKARGGN